MTTFATAVKSTPVIRTTDNGMKTYADSLNDCVTLFFCVGASRGKDITPTFERAYQEDRQLALRIAAWARDVRGGAGERETFRNILKFIEKNHPGELEQIISVVPEFGRYDDGYCLETKEGKEHWFTIVKNTIQQAQQAKFTLSKLDSMSEEECQKILDSIL